MIKPLGFSVDEKYLRRTGLDYWRSLDVKYYQDYEDFRNSNPGVSPIMATTKAKRLYTDIAYTPDCFIMFGKESAGIPEEILKENAENCVRIPMIGNSRSLNLSNAVAVVVYEALRQQGFGGLV